MQSLRKIPTAASGSSRWNKADVTHLLRSYHETHDVKTRDRLVEIHMNYVRYLAGRFRDGGEPLDDLCQVGCIGLLKAIERFKEISATQFITYATPTIVGEIKRYFRDRC